MIGPMGLDRVFTATAHAMRSPRRDDVDWLARSREHGTHVTRNDAPPVRSRAPDARVTTRRAERCSRHRTSVQPL